MDSGISALELTLRAAGIGPGHEVVTAANTFIATALAISHTGARPVLVDADPETHTLDPGRLEAAITGRTRAIVPVHLYGHPADMGPIGEIADAHRLFVLEDACQAHGARYRGRRAGSLGHAAAFSFYPAKNLGALGDGGAVTTNDEALAHAIRTLRDYGQRAKYDHVVKGFNRRLDTIQAAVLRAKLRRLDEWNQRRREHAASYSRLLAGAGIGVPTARADVEAVWHLYVVRSADRDRLRTHLAERGIETGLHYPIPVHLQPAFGDLGYTAGAFPTSERDAREAVSLPLYPELEEGAVPFVAQAVQEYSRIHLDERLTVEARRRRSQPEDGRTAAGLPSLATVEGELGS